MLAERARFLALFEPKSVDQLAEVERKYAGCEIPIRDDCKGYLVDIIMVLRNEIGAGDVSRESVDVALERYYVATRKWAKEKYEKGQLELY